MSRNTLIGMSKSLCVNCTKAPLSHKAPYGYACKIGIWRPGRYCSKAGCLKYNRKDIIARKETNPWETAQMKKS